MDNFRKRRGLSKSIALTISFTLFCLLFLSACSVPITRETHLSINGRLLDERGLPVSGTTVEIILPSSYGLSEVDLELGDPESYGRSELHNSVTTDASGTFSCLFSPLKYTSTLYLLPPLGSLPREAPEPKIYLKLGDTPGWYYALKVSEEEVVYAVYGEHDFLSIDRVKNKPIEISGRLIPDKRDDSTGWIADIVLHFLAKPERAELLPK